MQHRLTALLLVLSTTLICLNPLRAETTTPTPFKAEYSVSYKGAQAGRATLSMTESDGHWETRLATEAKGFFRLFAKYIESTEVSRFTVNDSGHISPVSYRLDRPGQKAGRRLLQIGFSGDTVDVERDTGTPQQHTLPEGGAWDRLSMLFSVPASVGARGEGDLELSIVGRHGPAVKRLELLGRAPLETQAGTFDTLHMRYHNGKRTAEYWIATEDGGFPVRMRYGEDGDDGGTMELSKLTR